MTVRTSARTVLVTLSLAAASSFAHAVPDLTLLRAPRCQGGEIPDGGFTIRNNETDKYYRVQVTGTTYGTRSGNVCTCNIDRTLELDPLDYVETVGCEFPMSTCDFDAIECVGGNHCSITIGGANVIAWSADGSTWHDYGNPPSIAVSGCDPVSAFCECE